MTNVRYVAQTLLEAQLRRRLQFLPDADWSASSLIIAPHPDDETLGCGGVACKKMAAGAMTSFIFVTDGAASHRYSTSPEALRQTREEEAREAVRRLGGSAEKIEFLRFPDGMASAYINEIAVALGLHLESSKPQSVFVPHALDSLPDHAAVNQATRRALRLYRRRVTVFEYPIWYWYHWPWVRLRGDLPGMWRMAARQSIRTGGGLAALTALNQQAYVGDVLEMKRAALAAHVTQTRRPEGETDWPTLSDISSGDFVCRFMTDYEMFSRYEVNA